MHRFHCARRTVLGLALLLVHTPAAWAQSVGILGITSEVVAIEKRLSAIREVVVQGYTFRVGTLNGHQVVVGRSGAGKVNGAIAATLLIERFKPSILFFTGTAGAVDASLKPGDVVIGSAVAQHDTGMLTPEGIRRRGLRNAVSGELDPVVVPAPPALVAAARGSIGDVTLPPIALAGGQRLPQIVEGVIATGDTFVSDVRRRDELRSSLGATAVEMEGGAVVQACRQFLVQCLVVRGITDYADGQALASYDQFFGIASENAATVVMRILQDLR